MKYRILIVDDEDSGRQTMSILLEKTFWAYIQSVELSKSFHEAQDKMLKSSYDIVFLDINLKGISAFDLLRFVPSTTKVIFVTAYSEFMLQALRNQAFDYLVKPVKEDELDACLRRIIEQSIMETSSSILYIKSRGITKPVPFSDIIYVEGDGPYSTFFLKSGEVKTAKTIKSILPDLNQSFIRIHKSYVVNKIYIKGFNRETLILFNGKWLPVSRTGYKQLSGL